MLSIVERPRLIVNVVDKRLHCSPVPVVKLSAIMCHASSTIALTHVLR